MKRIFAVLLAMGTITTVFAQSSRNQSRDVILGQGNNRSVYNNNRYDGYMTARERDQEIWRIRREYDLRIQAVNRDRYLRKSERKRQVRSLESQRDQEIRWVNERYLNSQRNSRYGRNDRTYGSRY